MLDVFSRSLSDRHNFKKYPSRILLAVLPCAVLTLNNTSSFAQTTLPLDATGGLQSETEPLVYDKNLSHPTFENYRLFRFEEDWSFLKDSSQSTDFFDPLKYIPLNSTGDYYLSLSGENREFVDHRSHQSLGVGTSANTVHSIEYEGRTTLGADLHLGPNFRAFGELINGAYNGPIPQNRNFNNNLAILDAFIEPMGQIDDTKFGLRVGRQQITLGNGLFVDNREIANLPLSWDGFRSYADWGIGRVDVFALNRVVRKEGVFEDERDHKSTLYGVYGSFDLPRFQLLGDTARITADPFFIGYSSEGQSFDVPALQLTHDAVPSFVTGEDYRQSYGVRFHGHIGDFDFDDTGIIQRGNFQGFSVQAWNFMTNTGYTFKNLAVDAALFDLFRRYFRWRRCTAEGSEYLPAGILLYAVLFRRAQLGADQLDRLFAPYRIQSVAGRQPGIL